MPRLCTFWLACLVFIIAPAQAETPQSMYERGKQLGKQGDFASAVPLIRAAAETGYADAQFTLGTMYAFGDGVPQSKTAARTWYERAAAQDHPTALYNLGLYHDRGISTPQDKARALEFYRRSAAAGNMNATYNAGHMLITGDGVQRDPQEGIRLFDKAADAGLPEAQVSLGYVYETGLGVRKNAERAMDYYAKAERNGIGGAGDRRLNLASAVLEEGLALEQDGRGNEALHLQDLACRYGQHYACYNAGRLRLKGEIVPKDVDRALTSLRAACDRGLDTACHYAADAVLSGADATPADRRRTVDHITRLCNRNNGAACHNLAFVKLRPDYGTLDPKAAQNLLAQNCLNRSFNASCQPYYDMYNASLPQSSSGRSSDGTSLIEDGILGIMSLAVDGLTALSVTGKYSSGSYGGYSSWSPPSTTTSSYSPQDNANFRNFMDSVKYPTVQCRPGNPYC